MYKPFIELFRTPNRNYFYEPNKNEFVEITDESFQYLWTVFNENADLPEMPDEIHQLIEMGYLAEKSNVEEVIHPYTKYLQSMHSRKVSKITLQLTQQCNFRCKYCIYSENTSRQQRKHSNYKMSWETAKKAIDFLWEHSADSSEINIGFYGGEPLLEFALIQKAVLYSEKKFLGKPLTFSITSNATLLTEEMINFFAAHEVYLMISLDGPKEINDSNRVFANGQGTYDKVMEKIQLVKNVNPDYANKLKFSMVMNPENDFDCINSINIESELINKWNIVASLVDKEYDMESLNFSEQYSYKYEYHKFLAVLAYYGRISKEVVSPIAYTSLKMTIDNNAKMLLTQGPLTFDAPGGPCIPGQLRLFSDYKGNLFPCERVSETSPVMHIGSIYSGFDYNKISNLLNIGKLTAEHCKKCWAFKYCTMCAKFADDGTNKLSASKKLINCKETRADVYEKLYIHLAMKDFQELYSKQLKNS